MIDPRLEIVKAVSLKKSRVLLSPQLIFLCGGEVDARRTTNHSVRNMFMNQSATYGTEKLIFVLAENFKDWKDGYTSLSDFENDIAHIASRIVIIPESPGSLTELGLFYGNVAIREKMTVVLNEPHHNAESFIKFGILNPLETSNQRAVLPYDLDYDDIEAVSSDEVDDAIAVIIEDCSKLDDSKSFSKGSRGYELFLIFQLIKLCHALTFTEIVSYLSDLDLSADKKLLRSSLYLLQRFDLVIYKKRGHTYFYCAKPGAPDRVELKHKDSKKKFDYPARSVEIFSYYESMAKKDRNFKTRTAVVKSLSMVS